MLAIQVSASASVMRIGLRLSTGIGRLA